MIDKVWINIEGFNGRYAVSNYGDVRSNARSVPTGTSTRRIEESILKQQVGYGGYKCVYLRKRAGEKTVCLYVHRLVAIHFIFNASDKQYVNHIDGNKHNNISSNLEWVTRSENSIHAIKLGISIPIHKRYKHDNGYKNKTSIQVIVVSEGMVTSIEESIISTTTKYKIDGKKLSGIRHIPKQHKGLKFYGIKLHEAGISWDKMQEYIGRPEGDLSEMLRH